MYDVWNLGKQEKYFWYILWKSLFFSFLPKSGPDKWCRVRKDRGHYGHFYWALVLGTYLGFGPHILVWHWWGTVADH